MFFIKNGLKEGDDLSPFFSNFVIRKVQEHQEGLKLNSMHHLLIMLMLIYWTEAYILLHKNTAALVTASKELDPEVNAEKTKNMPCFMTSSQDKITT